MSGPLDLTHWVERLKDQVSALKTVGLAGDLQRVVDVAKVLPSVWVMPGPESVAASEAGAQRRYRMRCQVDIVLALRHYGDSVGGKATDALRVLRVDIGQALIGWKPSDALVTVIPKGGSPIRMQANAMWWRERFETSVWR